MQSPGQTTVTVSNRMVEAETETKEAIVRKGYAGGTKRTMTIQLVKLLMICSLIAFIYSPIHAAELSNDPLPTVQENLATHKAILVDVREPGEWKEGHGSSVKEVRRLQRKDSLIFQPF